MTPIRLAIVGLGKIARDQHLPAIARAPDLELVAVASRNAGLDHVPSLSTLDALLGSGIPVDAIALCTPPQGRFAQAQAALCAGKHVFLEKPPGATLAEIAALEDLARRQGVTLFASWHSRFAACVEPARAFLAGRRIRAVRIEWKEDVRRWHPGQDWIWEPGGLGVLDPGINALSIATTILPRPFRLTRSELLFPANRAAPIAAQLVGEDADGAPVTAEFDWRQTGSQTWDIRVETESEALLLSEGGRRLAIEGHTEMSGEDAEYSGLYHRFAALVRSGRSDVDISPFMHVADAFMLGRRHQVEPFDDRL